MRTAYRVAPMTQLHVLSDDLLFGSRLQAQLSAEGHLVTLGPEVRPESEAIVADLTHDASARIAALTRFDGPVLGFYSHVETGVRDEARAAGIALVVPRSRIAREAPVLVEQLLATER
jgi:hypothetical protein